MSLQTMTLAERMRVYFVLTKPNVWWLLVFVGLGGYFAASRGAINPLTLLALVAALSAGSAGAETVANYLERDIDARMKRTRRRPLPRGLINPPQKAFILGLALIAASLIITGSFLNLTALLLMISGILNYNLIYVILTKKKTPLNIILGSVAGAAPVWVGYSSAASLDLTALVLGLLVILWIPVHVWSLALRYRDDYAAVGVPMLPVKVSERSAARVIASTTILLVVFSLTIALLDASYASPLYLGVTGAAGAALTAQALLVLANPTGQNTWRLFKFTSPYLAFIFLVVILESIL